MSRRELVAADPAPTPMGQSRRRVLAVLEGVSEPVSVPEVARQVRLHPNSVRLHLDALVAAGIAERTSESRDLPGRPRMLYRALPGRSQDGRRSYRLLAEILTSFIAGRTEQPANSARQAGEVWGRFLADPPVPGQAVDRAIAVRQLVEVLDEIGFAPEQVQAGPAGQVLLHNCPFREAAELNREVVCSVHLGLMRGLLGELDAEVGVERLDPFVRPTVCVTHLS